MSLSFKPRLESVDALYDTSANIKHQRDRDTEGSVALFKEDGSRGGKKRAENKLAKHRKPRKYVKRKAFTTKERELITDLRVHGFSIADISELLERSHSTVATHCSNHGGDILIGKQEIRKEILKRHGLSDKGLL